MACMQAIARLRICRPRSFKAVVFQHRPFSASTTPTPADIINEPIDEELLPGDRLKYFHPTHPGDILDDRFKVIVKMGFGSGSTVWLAENLQFWKIWRRPSVGRFVCIKIPALDANISDETERSKHISSANPSHDGLSFIRTPIDDFKLQGPQGTHSCLVYEPMRESLLYFRTRSPQEMLTVPLGKMYIFFILKAVDYLHTECRLIHTDIKDDNILITIENDAVLTDYVDYHKNNPQPRHVRAEDGRVVYLSQDEFGPPKGNYILPKLADFNLSFPGLPEGRGHLSPIQSHRYRAPEVLLGCPWSYSVDIWNVGLMMWDLLENVSPFGRPVDDDGEYDTHVHLARMISLLGDPPEELVRRERIYRNAQLRLMVNPQGKECKTMNEFWGGPFFDHDNQPFRKDLVTDKKLADTVTQLDGVEKEQFLDMAISMLQWLPEKRKTAKELLYHPFLEEIRKNDEQYGH